MVISIQEKKTITIRQEVGNREISSGLEKLKSLQKKITDEPELLSKFISENLDTSYNFESLKSNREESNRSIIYNNRALYSIDTKPIFDILIAKYLYFDSIKEDRLLSFFCDELKRKFDQLLSDLLLINSPKFKLEKVGSGFVPLFMFTDTQILNCIKEGENTYSFSTIKSIKKMTSEEQFERFMNLLSQI